MNRFYILILLLLFAIPGYTFDLDVPVDILNILEDKKSKPGSEPDIISLSDQLSEVVVSFNSALRNLSKSQMVFAEALDLKEVAEVAKGNGESLASGDLAGKDELEKVVSSSNEVQIKINKKMAESQLLSDESRVKFLTGVTPYLKGTADMVLTSNNSRSAALSLLNTRDLSILNKIATLVYVATESPNLISLFSTTTYTLAKFMSSNGLDTRELESASESLGE